MWNAGESFLGPPYNGLLHGLKLNIGLEYFVCLRFVSLDYSIVQLVTERVKLLLGLVKFSIAEIEIRWRIFSHQILLVSAIVL